MRRILIPMMLVFFVIGAGCQLSAQDDKKDKTVTIKIEKEEDGKKVKIDTTFTLKEGEDIDKVLKKYGIESEVMHHKHGKKFKFDIEMDDSVKSESDVMVWVSADDDKKVHEHIVKKGGKEKLIFIKEGDDDDIEVVELKVGEDVVWKDKDEHVFVERLDGDTVKVKSKIIIKSDKPHKNKIKSKNGVFIISDDDNEDVILKEFKGKGDSVEVIVKRIKKGRKGKHKKVIITEGGNYTWTVDDEDDIHEIHKNKKYDKVKIEILDINKEGLKVLGVKEGYKKFKEQDLNVFVEKGGKVRFNFTTPKKGSLTVKVVDTNGKIVFEDTDKKFDGSYKNEFKTKSGTYYLQVSQGKRLHLRKMIFDWKD